MDPIFASTDQTENGAASSAAMPSATDILAYLGGDDETPEPATPEPDYEPEADVEPEGEPEGEAEGEAVDGDGETEVESEEDVSGDGTPAEGDKRSRYIPRDRFDEVNRKYREAEERLQQSSGWLEVSDQFAGLGLTPEQVKAQLEAFLNSGTEAAPPPVPEPADAPEVMPTTDEAIQAAFHAELEAQGIDPGDLDSTVYWANRTTFTRAYRAEAMLQQQQARLDAQEKAAAEAREREQQARQAAKFQAELRQVTKQYPQFENETAMQALQGLHFGFDVPLMDAAKRLAETFTVATRNELAEAAVKKAQVTQKRPVTAGGKPPTPSRVVDYTQMSREQRVDAVAERLAAMGFRDD